MNDSQNMAFAEEIVKFMKHEMYRRVIGHGIDCRPQPQVHILTVSKALKILDNAKTLILESAIAQYSTDDDQKL